MVDMKKTEPEIKNNAGEKLDTWVEAPEGVVKGNVIMVHGFGTNKGETAGYFDDISRALVNDNFRVIRFDFSGYGKSEGRQEDVCYSKQVDDLKAILEYVKKNFEEDIFLFSQSMGAWVTSLYSPTGIKKTIFTGIPNSNIKDQFERFTNRFRKRPGAVLDFNGISLLPRSTGEVQKIGPQFWQGIRDLNPVKEVEEFSKKTDLMIFHWLNDDIIGIDNLQEYDAIKTVKSRWMSGDHSLTNLVDRQDFIKVMLEFYNKA
jgi:pimeloyl-ACP methyl ester carboxylesterase